MRVRGRRALRLVLGVLGAACLCGAPALAGDCVRPKQPFPPLDAPVDSPPADRYLDEVDTYLAEMDAYLACLRKEEESARYERTFVQDDANFYLRRDLVKGGAQAGADARAAP